MYEYFKDKSWRESFTKVDSHSDITYDFLERIINAIKEKPYLKPLSYFLNTISLEEFVCLVESIESPMEFYFALAWYLYADTDKYSLYPQWDIDGNNGKLYRADFHIVNDKEDGWGERGSDTPVRALIVEVDGHEYHSTKYQRERDSKRDREIIAEGYEIMRFTGSEIFKDAKACVQEVINYLERK